MINMLRKGIKFSIQRVYFPQSYFESRHYGKRFNSIGKFKSLTFQLRAIYFHTFAVDMSVVIFPLYGLYSVLFLSHYLPVTNSCTKLAAVFTIKAKSIQYITMAHVISIHSNIYTIYSFIPFSSTYTTLAPKK